MLNNFFRVSLPYGIARNESGEWMAFNREYLPLGFNNIDFQEPVDKGYNQVPIHAKYKKLTQKFLAELAHGPNGIDRNNAGEIIRVFLYNDGSIPVKSPEKKELWNNYFEKLKKLSKLELER